MSHELRVHVPGDVSTEQPADFPLLGVLDEVAVGGAGEERDRGRENRLRHHQPETAVEGQERRARPRGDERHGAERRDREGQGGGHQAGDERTSERRRHAPTTCGAGRMN